jgi:hypothetical protein
MDADIDDDCRLLLFIHVYPAAIRGWNFRFGESVAPDFTQTSCAVHHPFTLAGDDLPMFKRNLLPAALLMAQIVAAVPAAAAEPAGAPPDLTDARVTIPYSELKTLWAAAQPQQEKKKEESAPPVDSTIVSARYNLALDGDQAAGSAEFEIEGFADKWTVMPLLGTDAQLASVEPADAQVIIHKNHYALVFNHPGKQTVTIRFAAKLAATTGGSQLRLTVAPASINTLTVSGIPQKQAVRVAGATQLPADNAGAAFQLAPEDHIELNLLPEKSLEAPIPSHWKIEPQAFVEFTEGKLAYRARIAAHADGGSGLGMDLQFPPDANVSEITGDDLAAWQIKSVENQGQIAHLQWQTRDLLRREIEIVYDLPQPLTATQWKLLSPEVMDGESTPPLYLLALDPGLELTAPAASPVPRQLPKWLADRAEGINTMVFVGDAPLQARWLPLVQIPRAVAVTAGAKMQIVPDGAMLTEMDYDIRHEAAFSWKLTLPDGAELLSSSVDGRPVNPIDCGAHVIEFSLPAGRPENEVKLSYTAKGPPFAPVSGKIDLDLPETELLTNKLDWELHIPAAYEVAAFQGNVEPNANSGQTEAGSRVISLHREIFKDDRPGVELFYQKPAAAE